MYGEPALNGPLIRKIRYEHNLTLKQFASLFNMDYSVLSKIESGIYKSPSFILIVRISKHFKTDLNRFVVH